ncbi:hypothetical protein [Ornithinimicrobium sp. LYQ103]|uniref:hypothetical protein n=1 Tax=Ornithinimicrobium sp. LYQ103 TaxID=3378796 RepID=UPI0038541689
MSIEIPQHVTDGGVLVPAAHGSMVLVGVRARPLRRPLALVLPEGALRVSGRRSSRHEDIEDPDDEPHEV